MNDNKSGVCRRVDSRTFVNYFADEFTPNRESCPAEKIEDHKHIFGCESCFGRVSGAVRDIGYGTERYTRFHTNLAYFRDKSTSH